MKLSVKARDLVSQMSLEEKADFCSGYDFWQTKALPRLNLHRQFLADGPNGIRKRSDESDYYGIDMSIPAVCFPSAALAACSFDPEMMLRLGEALGDKCLRENVSMLLGPSVNIKRSPLGGRNYEYLSEDPYLSGEMAAGVVLGVQKKGVAACLKHFACNNQEFAHMINDSIMDERTLFEIYLTAFENVVKKASPWAVMLSNNRVNGVYPSESYWLIKQVLRDRWGYEGMVLSDWGGTANAVNAVVAGMDLEMPYSGPENAKRIADAVKNGDILESQLDMVVARTVEFVLRAQQNPCRPKRSEDEDHILACEIVEQSAVLLKNDGILPLSLQKVAFIGQLAAKPRIQGIGSNINSFSVDNALEVAEERGLNIQYAPGYPVDGSENEIALLEEALDVADQVETVVIFAGILEEEELDGYDRLDFHLSKCQIRLIQEVCKINSNVIVVLQCPGPVDMSWSVNVKAILLEYYAGEASGEATVNLLWGKVNPSGKLAETWPLRLEDTPSYAQFGKHRAYTEYRESLYVGYRYYDTLRIATAYPFGFGLSYTTFKYDNLEVRNIGNNYFEISVDLTNTGNRDGAEVVEVYITNTTTRIFRARKELKGFKKVFIKAGMTERVVLILERNAFRYHNPVAHKMSVEGGEYEISIAAGVDNVLLTKRVKVSGDGNEEALIPGTKEIPNYMNPPFPFRISDKEFDRLLGYRPSYRNKRNLKYDIHSTLRDIIDTPIGKVLYRRLLKETGRVIAEKNKKKVAFFVETTFMDMPLRSLTITMLLTHTQVGAVVDMANGEYVKGLKKWKR